VTETLERVKTYKQFIGGEFVDAADGKIADVINPANDKAIANVPASSSEDVDRAVNAAETAFATWRKTTPQDRSLMLLKIADALDARADELGRLESANTGKPVGAAIDEIVAPTLPLLRRCGDHGRPRSQRVAPATPRSSGVTRSASSRRSHHGTTRCTWRAGSWVRRSRPATRSS
jgi:acyl-CoA reductase-like NAD-dependent aldehyde dehydrogenase